MVTRSITEDGKAARASTGTARLHPGLPSMFKSSMLLGGLVPCGLHYIRHGLQRSLSGMSQTSSSKLNDVRHNPHTKVWKTSRHEHERTTLIMRQHHSELSSRGRAGTVMSGEDWQLYQERARKSPLFVVPLAKPGGGFLSLFTQMQLPFTLVTSLEEYRRYGASAPACMQVTHYTELLESAGLVLLRADCVNDKLVNALEARTLLELLRALYVDGEDYKQVLNFNHDPTSFDYNALLSKFGLQTTAGEVGRRA
ncbi:ATP11 protein-domain-containing protein [Haematococcus lacustris]